MFNFRPNFSPIFRTFCIQKEKLSLNPNIDISPCGRGAVVKCDEHILWAYGVVVSMFDFHRSDRGSNPGGGGKIS